MADTTIDLLKNSSYIGKMDELIAAVKSGGGLTTAQVNALDGMFKVCAFIKADISAEYTAFKTAFGIADEPVNPEVTLTSISATYSGGDVAVGTAVTDLTGIVVTAHYSDGSTAEVTGYTLSGEIAEGSNTITVSYDGKMTSFDVTGVAQGGSEKPTITTDAIFPLTLTWQLQRFNLTESLGSDGTSYNVEVDVESITSANAYIQISAMGAGGINTNFAKLYPNGNAGMVTATATLNSYTAGAATISVACNKGTETSNQTAIITDIRITEV